MKPLGTIGQSICEFAKDSLYKGYSFLHSFIFLLGAFLWRNRLKSLIFVFIIFILLPIAYYAMKVAMSKTAEEGRLNWFELFFVAIPNSFVALYSQRHLIWANLHRDYEAEYLKIRKQYKNQKIDYKNLEIVVRKFLNDGRFNRRDVLSKFQVDTDSYFCIIKSKEELDLLFRKKKDSSEEVALTELPFGKALRGLKGCLKPFGNLSVYFIPYSSIPEKYKGNIQEWLRGDILPEVSQAREKYVAKYGRKLRLKDYEISGLKPLSHTYLAFGVNKANIDFDIKNTKVNEDFYQLIRGDKNSLATYTNEIVQSINSSELFLQVSWNTIVNIKKKEYLYALEKEGDRLRQMFASRQVSNLREIGSMRVEDLQEILLQIFAKKYSWSNAIARNNAKKIIESINDLLRVLRKAGVAV